MLAVLGSGNILKHLDILHLVWAADVTATDQCLVINKVMYFRLNAAVLFVHAMDTLTDTFTVNPVDPGFFFG